MYCRQVAKTSVNVFLKGFFEELLCPWHNLQLVSVVSVCTPVWEFDWGTFWHLKQQKRTNPCGVSGRMLQGWRKDINKHQTKMRFTCLIINFLQVFTFQQGPVLERGRRGMRARGIRAEGRMSARNTSSALPNTKQASLSLSPFSLSSYFIPFVRGTQRTGLQRKLQWAHQSMPTDCGPTDTLEVGISFFVENVEKASTN